MQAAGDMGSRSCATPTRSRAMCATAMSARTPRARNTEQSDVSTRSIRIGVDVGLITTEGFRDVIEVGRETRYDLYDLFLEAPPTLVPRHRRREVQERMDFEGQELLPLDEAAVATIARELVDDGCEAIAIS